VHSLVKKLKIKISEFQPEQLSVLKVAKEQMIVVCSSLKTVSFTLTDVSANEIQLSENLNIIHKHITENS
jgi:hypothetical protein